MKIKYKKYYPGFKLKTLTFSLDDGTFQDKEMLNMFNRFNLKATFNINSKKMDHNGDFTMENWLKCYKIKGEDIKYIYQGHEVAAHSSTHTDFSDCSDETLEYEIDQDVKTLSELVGYKVVGFAYPYGIYNDKIIDRLKKNGIIYARSVKSDLTFNIPKNWYTFGGTCNISIDKLPNLVKRWNNLSPKQMKLFYIWGHSYELDMYHQHEKVFDLLSKLANKEDVYYGTNKDIFSYLAGFKKLRYNSNKNCLINNSDVDLYIEYNNQKVVINKRGEFKL